MNKIGDVVTVYCINVSGPRQGLIVSIDQLCIALDTDTADGTPTIVTIPWSNIASIWNDDAWNRWDANKA